MSGQNNRTLDLDRLFVRDIIFKDLSNRPISANKLLLTRGDGGTYFGNISTGANLTPSFTTIRADSNIIFTASNALNTLWFQPGSGINYYSTIVGNQPQLYINATAPEQIQIIGSGKVNFSSLTDTLDGGRTLYFGATDGASLYVSDNKILFSVAYNSSYSSLTELLSTVQEYYIEQSTLNTLLISSLSTVDTLLVSTGIASINSTLISQTDTVNNLSSFVYSTFINDNNGNRRIMQINSIHANNISTNSLTASSITTSSFGVGKNIISDTIADGKNGYLCTAFVSIGTLSTKTNFLQFNDTYTNVNAGIQKEYMYAQSTFGNSTFQTLGQQVQFGWFPTLSTQGNSYPPSQRDQFTTIFQSLQVLEQIITDNSTSSITRYTLRNIAKLDEICSDNGPIIVRPEMYISSLIVSSINNQTPGSGGGGGGGISSIVSTFQTIYVNKIAPYQYPRYVTISSIRVSSINDLPYGTFRALQTSSIYANIGIFSSITARNILAPAMSTNSLSTGTVATSSIRYGTAIGTNTSTTLLQFNNGFGQSLTFGNLLGLTANISSLQVSTIMGVDTPILTFDVVNRRMGVNLGAIQQPRAEVDVNGTIFAKNFVTTSDRRLKCNIRTLSVPNSIPNGYRYTTVEGEEEIGVMADEVESIAPECIYTTPSGYKAVNYMKLVPVCLTMIKSLESRLSALENDLL